MPLFVSSSRFCGFLFIIRCTRVIPFRFIPKEQTQQEELCTPLSETQLNRSRGGCYMQAKEAGYAVGERRVLKIAAIVAVAAALLLFP